MTDTPKPIDPNCPKCKGHGSTQRELAPNFIKHEACDCVAPDPRPSDMAELARLVAAELRKRGIWADVAGSPPECVRIPSAIHPTANINGHYRGQIVSIYGAEFDNLGPIACADEIQRQEAKRAQEWAGDK